jgi:hypothetical protein
VHFLSPPDFPLVSKAVSNKSCTYFDMYCSLTQTSRNVFLVTVLQINLGFMYSKGFLGLRASG